MALNIVSSNDTPPDRDPAMPPRDRYDRPMPFLPDGSKRSAYTRTSSAGGVLEDKENIMHWRTRLTAYGAYLQPDVVGSLRDITDIDSPEDKRLANKVAESLQEAAGASTKALNGTRVHELSEAIDAGEDLGFVPDHIMRVVSQYEGIVKLAKQQLGYAVYATELFGVNDTLKVAGTMDRVAWVQDELCIVDIKTSGSMEYSMGKFAMQMLGYAGMVRYNDQHATQGIDGFGLGVGRAPIHVEQPVSQTKGWLIWVPQSGETAAIAPVDLTAAAEGYKLAEQLREWRNKWARKAYRFTPVLTVM